MYSLVAHIPVHLKSRSALIDTYDAQVVVVSSWWYHNSPGSTANLPLAEGDPSKMPIVQDTCW